MATLTDELADAARVVTRFGIELELCHNDDGGYDDESTTCPDCGSCGDPNCESCSLCETCEDGYYAFRNGNSVAVAIDAMARHDLVEPAARQHSYHCGCERCSYSRSRPFFATQMDCTVGVEFVSRICDIRDDWPTVEKVCTALGDAYRFGVPRPDGLDPWGNHIHVGARSRNAIALWASALFASDHWNWDAIASGGCGSGQVRDYNEKPTKHAWGHYDRQGNWASARYHTVEFRLWNTPADPVLVGFHVSASLAITRWATAMQELHGSPPDLIRDFDGRQAPSETLDMLSQVWPDHSATSMHLQRLEANLC